MHQLSTGFSLEELQILKKKKQPLQILRHTKLTSNYHPENLVPNAIMRTQAWKSFSSSGKLLRKESYIHNYYKALQKTQKITLILFQWIRTFPHQYQQIIERLSDFLGKAGGRKQMKVLSLQMWPQLSLQKPMPLYSSFTSGLIQ